MSWFTKLCRNAGLSLHKASQAYKQEVGEKGGDKQEVKRTVEEEKINETTILRRTTIEEIEIKREEEE